MKNNRKRNVIFILTILMNTIYLFWRLLFTIPYDGGLFQALGGILLAAAETVTISGMAELIISKMKWEAKELVLPEVTETEYPDVDVFIATHNEPPQLLYKTINACTFLEYPDREKVHVYVCDDGDRKEIKQLAERFGVGYLGMEENTHAKSGNYNHAMSKTCSPIIATFDADMIPRREFLMKTVPYFMNPDLKLGLLQTPQSFYNQDLFQFNLFSEKEIPNEQDFFSREINIMRNASNSAAYTGSNTLLLRKALEEIGGFPYHTITEDFETSIRLQKEGYITYATSEVLASGLSTTTVESMIRQRIRWARGVIQSIQNTNAVFTGRLSAAGRLSYLNAYLYWWSFFCRMIFILAPVLFGLFDIRFVRCSFWELMIFWLPSYLLYGLSVKYLSTNIRNMRWSRIIDTILAPYLIFPVFFESMGIRQMKFSVTDKKKMKGNTASIRYLFPHILLIFLTAGAILRYSSGKYGTALLYSSVILYWLFHNLILLIYAVFFMLGRESKRKSDRIGAEEKAEIIVDNRTYEGITADVSEEGVSFRIPDHINGSAPDISEKTGFDIIVSNMHYRAVLHAVSVYSKEEQRGKFYAAAVTPADEISKRHWMQLIHDREHSLPKEIDPWMTVYDEIRRNILYRRIGNRER